MAYRNKTYVIFDGDNDIWAYGRMKGWKALRTIDFDFHDAHDLGSELTDRASEGTVKNRLRMRFSSAKQVIVLIGAQTRYLYRFVRWELDVALELDLPTVAVNLNGKRTIDTDRCPPIIRSEYVVHVPFKRAIIKYALDSFPREHESRASGASGPRYYPDSIYERLGLNTPLAPKFPPPPIPPLGNNLSGLLREMTPPPDPLFRLRDLVGWGGQPANKSANPPNPCRPKGPLK